MPRKKSKKSSPKKRARAPAKKRTAAPVAALAAVLKFIDVLIQDHNTPGQFVPGIQYTRNQLADVFVLPK
jgi:hypothetical protein